MNTRARKYHQSDYELLTNAHILIKNYEKYINEFIAFNSKINGAFLFELKTRLEIAEKLFSNSLGSSKIEYHQDKYNKPEEYDQGATNLRILIFNRLYEHLKILEGHARKVFRKKPELIHLFVLQKAENKTSDITNNVDLVA